MSTSNEEPSGLGELRLVFQGPLRFMHELRRLLQDSRADEDADGSLSVFISARGRPTPTPATTATPAATRSDEPTPPPADEPAS